MTREEAIRRLQSVRTELTMLIPRLTPGPARNMDACRNELDAVIEAIRDRLTDAPASQE